MNINELARAIALEKWRKTQMQYLRDLVVGPAEYVDVQTVEEVLRKAFQDGQEAAQVGNQSTQDANPVRSANPDAPFCPLGGAMYQPCAPQCAWWDSVSMECAVLALVKVVRKAAAK